MSFRAHGNWCGPGWSAHQWKDAKDLTEEDKQVEAIDELDQACKEHDIGIAEGDPDANIKFEEKASKLGIKGAAFAALVKWLGPSTESILQNKKNMPRRGVKEEEFEAWKSSNSIRLKNKADKDRKSYRDFQRDENRIYNAREDMSTDEEQKQDNAVVEALIDMQGDSFQTPARDTPRMAPTLTREDRPLRGPRSEGSLTNLLNQVDEEETKMAEPMDVAPMALRSASNTDGSGNTTKAGNRETLVKYNARAEMGIFTETRTAYLPITVYFSINRTAIQDAIPLHFRVDWPFDIFKRNALTAQSLRINYGEHQIRSRGLSNDMARFGLRGTTQSGQTNAANLQNIVGISGVDPAHNRAQLYPFPTTIKGSTAAVQGGAAVSGQSSSGTILDASAIPAYRRWYAKMYQYAHCMETDWRVTYFTGDANEEFQNVRVYEGRDCQSSNNVDTIPVDCELGQVDHWPYLKKHDIKQRTESNSISSYVINGTWTPNDQFPMKMVANEEDIKTWTKLGASDFEERTPSTYREDITLSLIHI